MNPYLRLWAVALAAAILFVFGRPVQAQHGDTASDAMPTNGVAWSGDGAARAESWQAMLPRRDKGPARFGLALDVKPGSEGRLRGLQWRMQLDADSTLALRLRSRQVSVQWRRQF